MSNKERTLYSVTLPWHTSDPGEGTYATSVWAENSDEATMMVALEMADVGQRYGTEDERRRWAQNLVVNAGSAQTIVMRVVDAIQQDLRELLAGPDGNAPDTEEKLREIMEMLGAPLPEVQRQSPRG